MATLKEWYSTSNALFTAVPAPATDHADVIKSLIYKRWAPYDCCLEDQDAWESWFDYLIEENWDRAEKLLESADLITDPLKDFSRTQTTTGTITDNDTLKIEHDEERADARSGYNNTNSESSTESDSSATAGISTTVQETPGKITTVKVSDTPQSATTNLTDGYLSGVTQTSESGTASTVTTPTGSDTGHEEGAAAGETRSNYLDAESMNATKTEQHSGSLEKVHNLTIKDEGYNQAQAELVLKYRDTLTAIKKEVAELFKDAFILWLGGEAY